MPSNEKLSCGKHTCPKHCHIIVDHSKMECTVVMESKCSAGHKILWSCHRKRAPDCPTCIAEARRIAERKMRDKKLEDERVAKQAAYLAELKEFDRKIEDARNRRRDNEEAVARAAVISQRKQELQDLLTPPAAPVQGDKSDKETKARSKRIATPDSASPSVSLPSPSSSDSPTDPDSSSTSAPPSSPDSQKQSLNSAPTSPEAQSTDDHPSDTIEEWKLPVSGAATEWSSIKALTAASNPALDELMQMIGLESIKEEFMRIKAKVDVSVRKGVALNEERFGAALLGNPGTGISRGLLYR